MSSNPEVIYHVSQSQLSVARHYGSCTFNGDVYYYNSVEDTLTRADVLKKRKVWRVIVSPNENSRDEYLGEEFKTRNAALKYAQKERNGREAVLFGPEGIEVRTWMKKE